MRLELHVDVGDLRETTAEIDSETTHWLSLIAATRNENTIKFLVSIYGELSVWVFE